jgi:peptidyl-dipeptidase A
MKKTFSKYLLLLFTLVAISSLLFLGCGKKEVMNMEPEFDKLVKEIEGKVKPLFNGMALAYFDATVSGKDELYQKSAQLEMDLNKILSDKNYFKQLKHFKETECIIDPIKKRHLDVLYLTFLSKQIDTNKLNEMTKLQTEIQKKYDTYRAEVNGKKLSDNEVEDILSSSYDSKELKEVWLAHKAIGPSVAEDLKKLVKMRNAAAKELGFSNYHEMSLKLSEQDPKEIEKLFDELDALTKDAFGKEKAEIDRVLSAKLKIKPEEMMPWHYQNRYFQEAPKIYDIDLDTYYTKSDLVKLTEDYYTSLGLPIEDIVAKSDLFEKPGKNQHAYCINIDKEARDIRVLCNVVPNEKWMNTLLHEYGHALYEKHLDAALPWDLKSPAHIFTTEAIAMMFGRFSSNANWMKDMLKISDEEKDKVKEIARKSLKLQQLVFSRWSQVMYRFEKSMYDNPDQDLNKLWWDLVEKYQGMKRPEGRNEPDWATKVHIATSPCYYHNYHLGELFASQLYYTLSDKVLKVKAEDNPTFYGKKEVGEYLIKNVFAPGAKYFWNDMIEKATGEKLTAKYYAKQFVN